MWKWDSLGGRIIYRECGETGVSLNHLHLLNKNWNFLSHFRSSVVKSGSGVNVWNSMQLLQKFLNSYFIQFSGPKHCPKYILCKLKSISVQKFIGNAGKSNFKGFLRAAVRSSWERQAKAELNIVDQRIRTVLHTGIMIYFGTTPTIRLFYGINLKMLCKRIGSNSLEWKNSDLGENERNHRVAVRSWLLSERLQRQNLLRSVLLQPDYL